MNTEANALLRLHRALGAIETVLAAALLATMVTLIFGGALARMLGQPLNWTTDLATACFAWACFICADLAWRQDALMSIEWAISRLPARARHLCVSVNHALIATALGAAVVLGIWLTWTSRARTFQGLADVSYSWVTASLPVGAALLLLTTVIKLRALWTAPPQGR